MSAPVAAQTAHDYDSCINKDGNVAPDAQVRGCTAIIDPGKESAPNLSSALFNRGRAFTRMKQRALAIADFTQAIRLNPTAQKWIGLGEAYANDKQYDRAIECFSAAIRLDATYSLAFSDRGTAYERVGQYDRAIADHTEAIRLDPNEGDNFNGRCWTLAVSGRDLDQAIKDCNEGLRLSPKDSGIYDSRWLVHLRLKQFDRAIDDYTSALSLNPEFASALYGRGYAKKQKGDVSGSAADVRAAKAIQNDIEEDFARYKLD
jgi:tetratricopeptide (TPR) repeat protein